MGALRRLLAAQRWRRGFFDCYLIVVAYLAAATRTYSSDGCRGAI